MIMPWPAECGSPVDQQDLRMRAQPRDPCHPLEPGHWPQQLRARWGRWVGSVRRAAVWSGAALAAGLGGAGATAMAAADDAPPEPPQYVALGVLVTELDPFNPQTQSFRVGFHVWHEGPADGPDYLSRLRVQNATEIIAIRQEDLALAGQRLSRRYIQARVAYNADLSRFPFDAHTLLIRLNIEGADYDELRFISDSSARILDQALAVEGWNLDGGTLYATRRTFSSNMGSGPGLWRNNARVQAEAHISITLSRNSTSGFWKRMAPALAAAGLALTVYFIPLTIGSALSPRFALIAGSVFTAVISMRQTANDIAAMDAISLADKMHIAVLAYIGICALVSVYTHWHHRSYQDGHHVIATDLRAALLSTLLLAITLVALWLSA